jgi:hypothetical protein
VEPAKPAEPTYDYDKDMRLSARDLSIALEIMDRINPPDLPRPKTEDDKKTPELIDWAVRVYAFSAFCQFREVLRSTLTLMGSNQVPVVFLCCRGLFELAAHAYYVKAKLTKKIDAKDWDAAWDLLLKVNFGSRYRHKRGTDVEGRCGLGNASIERQSTLAVHAKNWSTGLHGAPAICRGNIGVDPANERTVLFLERRGTARKRGPQLANSAAETLLAGTGPRPSPSFPRYSGSFVTARGCSDRTRRGPTGASEREGDRKALRSLGLRPPTTVGSGFRASLALDPIVLSEDRDPAVTRQLRGVTERVN